LVDRKIARRPIIAVAAFVLVLVQCTIEAVILI
jgi:hypothetical protein